MPTERYLLVLQCVVGCGDLPSLAYVEAPAASNSADAGSSAAESPARTNPTTHEIAWLPESVKRWMPHIKTAADAHDLDPCLLAIVVLIESHGDVNARGHDGATGLMQIMPKTARAIAKQRGMQAFRSATLHDPATNLDLGAWYLSRQLHDYRQLFGERAIELAAIAYNAGPARARAFAEHNEPVPARSLRYARLVYAMWSERERPRSETFERWWSGKL